MADTIAIHDSLSGDGQRIFTKHMAFARHSTAFCEPGKWAVSFSATFEEMQFLGAQGVPAVVDDFGNLRRVS